MATINFIVNTPAPSAPARQAVFNWTFSHASGTPRYGQYACGSYWVAPPVGQTNLTFDSLTGAGIPGETDLVTVDADPVTERRGIMNNAKSYGGYDADENELPLLPKAFTPASGSCVSLVACMQRNEAEGAGSGGTSAIKGEVADAYCVVTLVPDAPADNGANSIRPNITGATKEFLTWDDFDLTRLPRSGATAVADPAATMESIRAIWAHATEVFSMAYWNTDTNTGASHSEGGRAFRAHNLVDDYASGVSASYAASIFKVADSNVDLSVSKPALAAMLAYGLDIYHNRYNYGSNYPKRWASGAGQWAGQFLPAVFLAALLVDPTKGEVLKETIVNNFSTDEKLRGPLELRQVRRGITGVLLWGDGHETLRTNTTSLVTQDRRYWTELKGGNKFIGATGTPWTGQKTSCDLYGYIDGGPQAPGAGYLLTAGGPIVNMAATMLLIPKVREIVNTDETIEYADRIMRFGRWASPDPVSPPPLVDQTTCDVWGSDGGCEEYRITWGPRTDDVRFAIEGNGPRFDASTYHGANAKPNYRASQVSARWDSLMATYDGATYEDNVVALTKVAKPDAYIYGGNVYVRHGDPVASIYYTDDDTEPTSGSTPVSGPIAIGLSTTIKLRAYSSGKTASDVLTLSDLVERVEPVTFNLPSREYETAQELTLSCSTPDAVIHYTTNGDTPTTGSSVYSAPLNITELTVVKAIGAKEGFASSHPTTETINVLPPGQPAAPLNFRVLE